MNRFQQWISGWTGLIDALIIIITFTAWCPKLQLKYALYCAGIRT